MKRISTLLASALLFATLVLIDSSATASDTKSYPAFMCREEGVGGGDYHFSPYRVTRAKDSTGEKWILCPIVKDNFGGGGPPLYGPRELTVKVRINDQSFSREVKCELWGLSDDMTRKVYVTKNTVATGMQTITLSSTITSDFEFFRCMIPTNEPAGQYFRFIGYTVDE